MPQQPNERPGAEHIQLYEAMDSEWLEARRLECLTQFASDPDRTKAKYYVKVVQIIDMVLAARPRPRWKG